MLSNLLKPKSIKKRKKMYLLILIMPMTGALLTTIWGRK
jgi:hypothetical protein